MPVVLLHNVKFQRLRRSEASEQTGSVPHAWGYVPFSTHHGWEPPEYCCGVCGQRFKGTDPPHVPCAQVAEDEYL